MLAGYAVDGGSTKRTVQLALAVAGLGQNGAMDLHLSGKVVLITGGTDGLGAALADRLVEEGAKVVDNTLQPLAKITGDLLPTFK